MRELGNSEILAVGGALALPPLTFTTPITLRVLNNVAQGTTVYGLASASFSVGYAIGSYLDSKFGISTKIVDLISD